MCSYPCFGLSKTNFTPPSQLLKTVQFVYLTFNKIASLPIQKSTAKTASLPIQKSAAIVESTFFLGVYIDIAYVVSQFVALPTTVH
jgi:hypothetical protein